MAGIEEETLLSKEIIKSGLSNIARSSNGRDYVFVSLDLPAKHLNSLEDVKGYQEIKYINVKNNQLTSAEPLSELLNLLSANLQFNQITSFSDMKNNSLQLLQLDNNKVTSLGDACFPALRALTLKKNQITQLTDMKDLYPCLEVLDLSHNRITSLVTLSSLPSLKAVNLNNNLITNLDGVADCKNLSKFLISDNQLPNVTELKKLQPLKLLTVLDVKNNMPMYEETPDEETIQREVLIMLPQLNRCNALTIDVAQRVEADTLNKERVAEQEELLRQKMEEEAAAKAEAEAEAGEGGEKEDDEGGDDDEGDDDE